jgi:elongation factor P
MATVNGGNLKKGLYVLFKNEPYQVVGTQFVSPGKGSAFTRAKLKNAKTGSTLEFTFKSTENLEVLDVSSREVTFSYLDGDEVSFMDMRTYEQFNIPRKLIEDKVGLLVPELNVYITFFNEEAIGVSFPPKIKAKVTEAAEGVQGDRKTAGDKPVTLETGLVVQAPLFIKTGDVLLIDTDTMKYVSRAN